MTVTINSLHTVLTLSSTLLNNFIGNEEDYTKITITGYFNDTETGVTETYDEDDPITSSTNVRTEAGVETLVPAFFTTTEFGEGVYHFLVTLYGETIETDSGCIYVEDGLKCDVDDYMLDESIPILERVLAGLKYNSIVSSAECPCKCDQKIEIYNSLTHIQDTCKTC